MFLMQLLFSLVDYVNDADSFFYLSLLSQVIGGIGAGLISTNNWAIISNFTD